MSVIAVGVDSGVASDAGRSNPSGAFRYDPSLGAAGGYIYDLSTRELAAGEHRLKITAGGDPTVHELVFTLR